MSAQIIYLAGYFGWKRQQTNARIVREYKGYIHAYPVIAVELSAAALNVPVMRVRDVIGAAGALF